MRGTLRAFLLLGLMAFSACGHGAPDIATLTSNSDQVIWEAGQKALSKHDWESARQHFKRIIDAFPQSQYAPSARLALGDAYMQEGGTSNDILAIGAYREFLTLYPSHPKSDYAQFQVAESYFRQKSGPDRDQTQTLHALEEYERLLDLYADSPYVENATTQPVCERARQARMCLKSPPTSLPFFTVTLPPSSTAEISRSRTFGLESISFATSWRSTNEPCE